MITDGQVCAIASSVAPGQAHELPITPMLLAELPPAPLWVVGDWGYARVDLANGSRPAIPTKRDEEAVACSDYVYNNRNRGERL